MNKNRRKKRREKKTKNSVNFKWAITLTGIHKAKWPKIKEKRREQNTQKNCKQERLYTYRCIYMYKRRAYCLWIAVEL